MKKTNILLILFVYCMLLEYACVNNSKNKIEAEWKQISFRNYHLKMPPELELYYFSKDSLNGVISNGTIKDGIITNSDINIELNGGFGVPSVFEDGATILKNKIIGSVKKKALIYTSGLNRGLILICVWDTLKSTKLFRGPTRYSNITLSIKNADSNQKGIMLKIFDSIYPISQHSEFRQHTM
ncbi:MAG: hypothetical protein JWP94_2704 [Mucilaginibacter sp.]|nr:hypothetical protein [Mucilaginibacter sp.]